MGRRPERGRGEQRGRKEEKEGGLEEPVRLRDGRRKE